MQRFPVFVSLGILFASSVAFAQDEAIDVEGPPPELTGLKEEVVQMSKKCLGLRAMYPRQNLISHVL